MRIGVFGGTFDPPHLGHLVAAQEIHWQLELDRLLLVPAAVPPHKRDREVSAGAVRLEMLRAAAGDDPRFEVSDAELRRGGASYSVDTLRALHDAYGGPPPAAGIELFLAMGADQAAEFDTWREPDAIAELAALALFAREGQAVPELPGRRVAHVTVPTLEISSTDIRRRVRAGEPIRYLVPEAVEAIIEREGLYRA